MKIRLPEGLLRAIKASAKNNGRSVNSEIVRHLREMVKPDTKFEVGDRVKYTGNEEVIYGTIRRVTVGDNWVELKKHAGTRDIGPRYIVPAGQCIKDNKLRIEE